MIRRPPRSTRTDTLFPYTTLFRSLTSRMMVTDAIDDNVLEDYHYYPLQFRDNDPENRHDGGVILEQLNPAPGRSEENTSELQSLMRISYAVFCLKKKTINKLY